LYSVLAVSVCSLDRLFVVRTMNRRLPWLAPLPTSRRGLHQRTDPCTSSDGLANVRLKYAMKFKQLRAPNRHRGDDPRLDHLPHDTPNPTSIWFSPRACFGRIHEPIRGLDPTRRLPARHRLHHPATSLLPRADGTFTRLAPPASPSSLLSSMDVQISPTHPPRNPPYRGQPSALIGLAKQLSTSVSACGPSVVGANPPGRHHLCRSCTTSRARLFLVTRTR